MSLPNRFEVAVPYDCGSCILDGDEDSQVVVYEDGAVTWWALQFQKWRNYFHIPDDLPLSSSSASSGAVDGPVGEHEEQGAQGQKRNAEEAGLELN